MRKIDPIIVGRKKKKYIFLLYTWTFYHFFFWGGGARASGPSGHSWLRLWLKSHAIFIFGRIEKKKKSGNAFTRGICGSRTEKSPPYKREKSPTCIIRTTDMYMYILCECAFLWMKTVKGCPVYLYRCTYDVHVGGLVRSTLSELDRNRTCLAAFDVQQVRRTRSRAFGANDVFGRVLASRFLYG